MYMINRLKLDDVIPVHPYIPVIRTALTCFEINSIKTN